MVEIELPELLWHGGGTARVALPDDWQVDLCRMRGAEAPPLSLRAMEAAIHRPIGAPRLRELARGKRRAVIVFDDMTRPTRLDELGPIAVTELLEAGLAEEAISFVCALGSHGPLSRSELRKKAGSALLERFRFYNHNCYEGCVDVGVTSRGTRLAINREVMEADIKVGIGCVTAHAQAGFSGGGKIVLPGVAHIDSIAHYHIEVPKAAPGTTGLGCYGENAMRFDIEEAARMVGLDFKIDVLVNEAGQATHLFAGEFQAVHAESVAVAAEHYALEPRPLDRDVMICNAFCKPNEMPIAYLVGLLGLERYRGTVVIVANAPDGQVTHYLLGRFGREHGGRQYPISSVLPGVNLIIQAPHLDRGFADWFGNPEVVTFTRNWVETRALLEERHGPGTRAAVVPSATMAYYR